MLTTEWTSVDELRALIWIPEEPVGGVVLVDGSGPGVGPAAQDRYRIDVDL